MVTEDTALSSVVGQFLGKQGEIVISHSMG